MFDCAMQLQSTKHTFFQRIRAQELISSMQLMTSKQSLRVFRQIIFQITMRWFFRLTFPCRLREGKDTGKTMSRATKTKPSQKRFRNEMENMEEKTK